MAGLGWYAGGVRSVAGKPSPVPPDVIEIRTSKQVRAYLDQLIMGGLYGGTVNDAAERIVTRAIEDLLRRGELTRLPPMTPVEPRDAAVREKPPASEDTENT